MCISDRERWVFYYFLTWKFALKLLYSPWEITNIFTFIFDKCSKIPGNVQNETLFSGQKVGDCSQCQYKMFLDVRHGGRLKFCFFNDRATKKAEMILYCITFKYLVDLQHIARKTLSNILSQISQSSQTSSRRVFNWYRKNWYWISEKCCLCFLLFKPKNYSWIDNLARVRKML